MKHFLSDPDSGCLDLESHCLALAIAKKTLDENQFKHAQKMTKLHPTQFQSWCIECNGHYLHIENQATGKTRICNVKDVVYELPVKLWNIHTMFGRAGIFINHQANLPTLPLNTT